MQWRVLRGERLAAARDGKKIKDALERALELDPQLNDAYFGIGLYHYYADVAPTAAKILRWLLLLPGGDRVQGLREMLRARERGELLTGEADYQLHLLYLWYEQKPAEALALLERLDARYPSNPLFLQRVADVQTGSPSRSPGERGGLAAAAVPRAGGPGLHGAPRRTARPARPRPRARLDGRNRPGGGPVEDRNRRNALAASGDRAEAQLQLGAAYDRLGQRNLAVAAYRAALALAPEDASPRVRDRARAGLDLTPDARSAEAYRISLEGWRALEQGDAAGGAARLGRAVALAPNDSVARYRYARALEARGDDERARKELERVIAARAVPAIALASALVDYAQMLERAGDRDRALAMYRNAARVVGGDPRARDQATRAITRLSP